MALHAKRWLGPLVFFLLFFHCQREAARSFETDCYCEASCAEVRLESDRFIDFPVAGMAYDFAMTTWYAAGKESQFWGYYPPERTLYAFDAHRLDTLKTIVLPTQGPGAIPQIRGFQVWSPDSILLHTGVNGQLLLIDDRARVLRTWSLPRPASPQNRSQGGYYSTMWGPYNTSQLSYDRKNERLTIFLFNIGSQPTISADQFEHPQFATLDLAKDTITATFGASPSSYRNPERSAYFLFSPFVVVDGETWTSFEYSHCLYGFRQDEEQWSVCSRSRYLPDRFTLLPSGLRPAERDPALIRSADYDNLLYDPYRKIFYRIAIHGLPEGAAVGRDWNRRKQSRWSILFLDREGDCLGEAVFPANRYSYDLVFPTPEGMVVGRENPYDAENEEDVFRFAVFELKELQQ